MEVITAKEARELTKRARAFKILKDIEREIKASALKENNSVSLDITKWVAGYGEERNSKEHDYQFAKEILKEQGFDVVESRPYFKHFHSCLGFLKVSW